MSIIAIFATRDYNVRYLCRNGKCRNKPKFQKYPSTVVHVFTSKKHPECKIESSYFDQNKHYFGVSFELFE